MSIVFGDGGYLTRPDLHSCGLRTDICNPWIKKPPTVIRRMSHNIMISSGAC